MAFNPKLISGSPSPIVDPDSEQHTPADPSAPADLLSAAQDRENNPTRGGAGKGKGKKPKPGDPDYQPPKPSIESVYADFLLACENVRIAGGLDDLGSVDTGLYRWDDVCWRRQTDLSEQAEAFTFLKRRSQPQATASKANDCLSTARVAMIAAGSRRWLPPVSQSPEKGVFIPVGVPGQMAVYLKLTKEAGAQVFPCDKNVGLTYCIPAAFDTKAFPIGSTYYPPDVPASSMWGQYLDLFLPDLGVRNALQEAAGASILPINFEKAHFLLGSGSNGKSTFLSMLEKLHPYRTPIRLSLLEDKHALSVLPGKTLYVAAENAKFIGEGNEQIMKALISRDLLQYEPKFKDPLPFRPTGTLFVAMNSYYRFGDRTYGLKRKVNQYPFEVRLDERDPRMDKDFVQKLLASPEEMGYFFSWVIAGALRLLKQGRFSDVSETVAEFDVRQSMETDTVFSFLTEHEAEVSEEEWVKKEDVYTAYREFCKQRGSERVDTDSNFFTRVIEFFRRKDPTFKRLPERQAYAPKGEVRKRLVGLKLLSVKAAGGEQE